MQLESDPWPGWSASVWPMGVGTRSHETSGCCLPEFTLNQAFTGHTGHQEKAKPSCLASPQIPVGRSVSGGSEASGQVLEAVSSHVLCLPVGTLLKNDAGSIRHITATIIVLLRTGAVLRVCGGQSPAGVPGGCVGPLLCNREQPGGGPQRARCRGRRGREARSCGPSWGSSCPLISRLLASRLSHLDHRAFLAPGTAMSRPGSGPCRGEAGSCMPPALQVCSRSVGGHSGRRKGPCILDRRAQGLVAGGVGGSQFTAAQHIFIELLSPTLCTRPLRNVKIRPISAFKGLKIK